MGRSGRSAGHRGYGATAARLTPDQKVGSSNLSGLMFAATSDAATRTEHEASRNDWVGARPQRGAAAVRTNAMPTAGVRDGSGQGQSICVGRCGHRKAASLAMTSHRKSSAARMCQCEPSGRNVRHTLNGSRNGRPRAVNMWAPRPIRAPPTSADARLTTLRV